jgi:hypothetical protein
MRFLNWLARARIQDLTAQADSRDRLIGQAWFHANNRGKEKQQTSKSRRPVMPHDSTILPKKIEPRSGGNAAQFGSLDCPRFPTLA